MAWRLQKTDAGSNEGGMITREIIGFKEQEDTAGRLSSDHVPLFKASGTGEEKLATALGSARRRDDHPTLAPRDGTILDQSEAELGREPGDGLVIVVNKQRGEAEVRHLRF